MYKVQAGSNFVSFKTKKEADLVFELLEGSDTSCVLKKGQVTVREYKQRFKTFDEVQMEVIAEELEDITRLINASALDLEALVDRSKTNEGAIKEIKADLADIKTFKLTLDKMSKEVLSSPLPMCTGSSGSMCPTNIRDLCISLYFQSIEMQRMLTDIKSFFKPISLKEMFTSLKSKFTKKQDIYEDD